MLITKDVLVWFKQKSLKKIQITLYNCLDLYFVPTSCFHAPCCVHLKGRIVSERGDNSFKMRWYLVAFGSDGGIWVGGLDVLTPLSLVRNGIFPLKSAPSGVVGYRESSSPPRCSQLAHSRTHSLCSRTQKEQCDLHDDRVGRPGTASSPSPSRRNPSAFMFKWRRTRQTCMAIY